jgi:signal transduction histidine kinase
MGNKNIPDLDTYLEKGAITIFKVFIVISCFGYLADIINFHQASTKVICNNLTTLSITLVSFLLFYFKKIGFRLSFGIILYAAIGNVVIDTFTDLYSPNRLYFFFRDSLFIIFSFTLASFIVGRVHAIIISILYMIFIIILNALLDNAFLHSSIYILVVFISVYGMVIYYFVGIIEKSILERDRLNKTKDKFLSIVAHDLKNPFNVILGFTELLEIGFDKMDDEKKRNYIKTLNVTARKTYNLLEDLLNWARAQSDTLEFNPVKIALDVLLKQNLFLFLESIKNKKIDIIENVKANCFSVADENMIDTVLRNLISNAIKFTPEGGKITCHCKIENNMVVVEIADTGIGMNHEGLNKLFHIDKTHSTTGTAGETGTGLGLLICKEFIARNKGKIWVSSEDGKGSTFSFSLPVAF